MANYSTLKAAVADVVKTNGTQAITGANLQAVLLSIINSVGGGGYIFKGVATPSTDAGTPDQNVFYIGGAGTYANFGTSVTVPVGSICVFKYNGSWAKEQINMFGVDDAPTAGSDNLVRSGGVATEIEELDDEVFGTDNTEYVDFHIVAGNGSYYETTLIKKGTYNITVTDTNNVLPRFAILYLNGTRIGYAKSISNPLSINEDVTEVHLYSPTDPSSSGDITINFNDNEITQSLDSKIEDVALDVRNMDYRYGSSWGDVNYIPFEFTTGVDRVAADVYNVNIPKNTDFIIKAGSFTGILSIVSIPIYVLYEDLTTENIGGLTNNGSLASIKTKNIIGVSTYVSGENIVSGGNIDINIEIVGDKQKYIYQEIDINSKKVELIVYIGQNSSGHTFAVGDRMFNTTTKKIAICTKASPSPKFTNYYPPVEAIYIYDNWIYTWDNNLQELIPCEKLTDEDYGIILSCYGSLSKNYIVEQGVSKQINHENNSSEAIKFIIKKGEWFDIIMTTTALSKCFFYADNGVTAQRLYATSNGHYVAPFDFNMLSMYYTEAQAISSGNLTITIKKISFPELTNQFKGNGNIEYYGEKLPSLDLFNNTFRCSREELISIEQTSEGVDAARSAGLVVMNGRVFNFLDNNGYCLIYDLETLTLLQKASTPWSSHNNNAQPTPFYYSDSDNFPLMLVSRGDYANVGIQGQKFYYVRVVESNNSFTFTIVKEISYSGFAGAEYNCSFFADYANNELYSYSYPNGDWSVTENNPVIFHVFDLPAWDDETITTLGENDIKRTITLRDHLVTQSGLFHDGKIYLQAGVSLEWDNATINGNPYNAAQHSNQAAYLMVIDCKSGYIETLVPLDAEIEQEGLCIYNNAIYINEKYTLAPVGRTCYRLLKYVFN